MIVDNVDFAAHASLPTYQNRLRVIGRQLDLGGYRSLNLVEIAGGVLVRVMRPGERVPQALEFAHADFPDLLATAKAARGEGRRAHRNHPLLPSGYEDFLRALGYRLDVQCAEAIAIAELDSFIAVNGIAPLEAHRETTMVPFQSLLRPDDIAELLDEAFRRRKPAARSTTLARMFGR